MLIPVGATGRPVLRFDGIDDSFNFVTLDSNTQHEMTVFVALRANVKSSAHKVLYRPDSPITQLEVSASGQWSWNDGSSQGVNGGSASEWQVVTGATQTVSGDTIKSILYRKAASNSTTIGDTSSTPTFGDHQLNYLFNKDGSEYFSGDVGEIVVYSRTLTDDERLQVETYLHNKWVKEIVTGVLTEGGSASSSGGSAAFAFDGDEETSWTDASADYLRYALPKAHSLRSYSFTTTDTNCPASWDLEASNDASSWTTVDQQTGQECRNNLVQTFAIANMLSYQYYQWRFTGNVQLREVVIRADPCRPGYFFDENNADFCVACPTGYLQQHSGTYHCDLCPMGTFTIDVAQTACITCRAGTYGLSVTDHTSQDAHCEGCQTGRYGGGADQSHERGHCINCPPGKYEETSGQTTCKLCALGKFQDDDDQMECKLCAKGTYAAHLGMVNCKGCEMGRYMPYTGKKYCFGCGENSIDGAVNNLTANFCWWKFCTIGIEHTLRASYAAAAAALDVAVQASHAKSLPWDDPTNATRWGDASVRMKWDGTVDWADGTSDGRSAKESRRLKERAVYFAEEAAFRSGSNAATVASARANSTAQEVAAAAVAAAATAYAIYPGMAGQVNHTQLVTIIAKVALDAGDQTSAPELAACAVGSALSRLAQSVDDVEFLASSISANIGGDLESVRSATSIAYATHFYTRGLIEQLTAHTARFKRLTGASDKEVAFVTGRVHGALAAIRGHNADGLWQAEADGTANEYLRLGKTWQEASVVGAEAAATTAYRWGYSATNVKTLATKMVVYVGKSIGEDRNSLQTAQASAQATGSASEITGSTMTDVGFDAVEAARGVLAAMTPYENPLELQVELYSKWAGEIVEKAARARGFNTDDAKRSGDETSTLVKITDFDCRVSQWTNWSKCAPGCGGYNSTVHRTRLLVSPSNGDGASCSLPKYKLAEQMQCTTPLCGLKLSPGSFETDEAGATVIMNVALNSTPFSPVVLTLSVTDGSEAEVTPSIIALGPNNAELGETVRITGSRDGFFDGDIPYKVKVEQLITKDKDYKAVILKQEVNLTNLDAPENRLRILTAGKRNGTCVTTENGNYTEIEVSLNFWYTGENAYEEVVVTVITSNPGEALINCGAYGIGEKSTVVFTQDDWDKIDLSKTCTVHPRDDDYDDGDVRYEIQVEKTTIRMKDGQVFQVFPMQLPAGVECVNIDDDVVGIRAEQTCTKVSEVGSSCWLEVSARTRPESDVTFTLTSTDTGEGQVVTGSSFTVTPSRWKKQTAVRVQGIDDSVADDNQAFNVTGVTASADPLYNGLSFTWQFINEDNDNQALVVMQDGQPLSGPSAVTPKDTDETESTTEITVALAALPEQNVTVDISSSDVTEVHVSPTKLIFTAANWKTPQFVTVTGVDDTDVDGPVEVLVRLETTSADPEYDDIKWNYLLKNHDDELLALSAVKCSIYENDPGAPCTIDVATSSWEAGSFVSVEAQLINECSDLVSTTPTSLSVYTAASSQTLSFSSVNDEIDYGVDYECNTTVKGVLSYKHSPSSLTQTKTINSVRIAITSVEDDTASVVLTHDSDLTTEARLGSVDGVGGMPHASTMRVKSTVVLTSEPLQPVTIAISSSNAMEGVPSVEQMVFNSTNWNVVQHFEVSGVDDQVHDYNQTYTIAVNALSDDSLYSGMQESFELTNIDDDIVGIRFTSIHNTTAEDGSQFGLMTMRLTSEPKAPVLFTLDDVPSTEARFNPLVIVFTPADWNTDQEVKVLGMPDSTKDGADGFVEFTVHATVLFSHDPDYSAASPQMQEDHQLSFINIDDPHRWPGSSFCRPGFWGAAPNCTVCPVGKYKQGKTDKLAFCKECMVGTFSSVEGSASPTACLPCHKGTYNNKLAQASCFVCPTGTHCDVPGMSAPMAFALSSLEDSVKQNWDVKEGFNFQDLYAFAASSIPTNTSDSLALEEHAEFEALKKYYYKVRGIMLGIMLALIIGLLAIIAIHVCSKMRIGPAVRAHVWITHRDRFWRSHLPDGDKEQIEWTNSMVRTWPKAEDTWLKSKKSRTFMGGLCSILFYILTIPGAVLFVWIYLFYNESRSQALIPRSFSNDDIVSDFIFTTQFLGYSGRCSGFAAGTVQVSGFQFAAADETISIGCLPGENGTLEVKWHAKDAKIASIPKIKIAIEPTVNVAVAAAAVQWQISASSVVAGEMNSVEGAFKPRKGQVLRGKEESILYINLMATSYENQVDKKQVAKGVGWRPKYGGQIVLGDVKTGDNFMTGHTSGENALKLMVAIEVETAQLEMLVVPSTTVSVLVSFSRPALLYFNVLSLALALLQWLDCVSFIGGMFAAVTATCVEFMNMYESRQDVYDRTNAKITKFKSKTHAQRLCWIIDTLDLFGGLVSKEPPPPCPHPTQQIKASLSVLTISVD
jgi:hypothetical protein